jgi:cytochrome c peroxidase
MTKQFGIWVVVVAVVAAAGLYFLGNQESLQTRVNITHVDEMVTPEMAKAHFGILPKVAESPFNLVTPEKVALGKALFFDPRLSKSGFISCNSCHNLAFGGVDGLPTSVGHRWKIGPRNAPTVLNAALHAAQFWDGRAKDVEEQAGKPILSPGEMASNEQLVMARLESISQYVKMFKEAFADEPDTMTYNNVARAIAAYERTLLTPSRLDRFLAGDSAVLTAEEKAGLKTFVDVGCVTCHNGVALGGNLFRKFGVVRQPEGLTDAGRFEVTKKEEDRYVFKVPSLRNIALTAPYFHDGKVWALEEAIRIMADVQLGRELSPTDLGRIAKFLVALNGEPAPQVTLPNLPPSTASTSPPAFD